ncbi:RICIN domain-containing protein [Saccharothrix sp. HUAS TT1]|uniref:RICIN domain-containing protein n=1 Tax=unclassified Saccharothrix TaxID=2593673 RepID=UPI00345B5DF0
MHAHGGGIRRDVLTQQSDAGLAVANIERPKVIYNSATGRFVMWTHKENGSDYTWHGSFRPLGHMSRDITLFRDDDGAGYMISAARENADLHVYRLTADYRQVESRVRVLWAGSWREAPAMFKRDGVYFLLTSGATGWDPNQQKYATASSVAGTWSALRDIGDGTAYGSQTAFVLPVQGTQTTSYLYLGDRWAGAWDGRVNDSRYVWLPLTFPSSTTMSMSYASQLTIDAAAGTVTPVSSPSYALTARRSGKCADIPSASQVAGTQLKQYPCNGANQRWDAENAGSGHHRLVARHSALCLDVTSASTADRATVAQRACNGGTNQQWSR